MKLITFVKKSPERTLRDKIISELEKKYPNIKVDNSIIHEIATTESLAYNVLEVYTIEDWSELATLYTYVRNNLNKDIVVVSSQEDSNNYLEGLKPYCEVIVLDDE